MDESSKPFVYGFGGGALAALLLRQKPKETSQPAPSDDEDDVPRIEFIQTDMAQFPSPGTGPSPIPTDTINAAYPAIPVPADATHFLAVVMDQSPVSGTTLPILCLSTGAAILPTFGQATLQPQLKWMVNGFAPLVGGEVVATGAISWLRIVE